MKEDTNPINDSEPNNPIENFINDELEIDLPAEDPELSVPNIAKFLADIMFDKAEFNPITGAPWKGEFDDNVIYMGPGTLWPELDAKEMLDSMEEGSISFEYFKKFAIMIAQDRDIKISTKFATEWFKSRTTKKFPWDMIDDYLNIHDLFYVPDDLSTDDLYPKESENPTGIDLIASLLAKILIDTSYYDNDPRVQTARISFIEEIKGKDFSAKDFAHVIYRHFKFVDGTELNESKSLAITHASSYLIILGNCKKRGSFHSDNFNVGKYLNELCNNDLSES